jgi:linolenate 9R-lipoxygenase
MSADAITPQPQPKDVFKYFGTAGQDLPRFNPELPLPPRVAPSPQLVASMGLFALPAEPAGPIKMLGIVGVGEIIQMLKSATVMPANLTRCCPDKFSDDFFVERRLNGFNPGKMKQVQDKPWQYIIRYDCSKHKLKKPDAILPAVIEARFVLNGQSLQVHSIEYQLQEVTTTNVPDDTDWEWAKRLFRCAEIVFQESQSHLARTHLNVEQYALPFYRNIVDNPIKLLLEPHFEGLLNVNKLGNHTIFGKEGILPQASALDAEQVEQLMKEEVSKLNYHNWHPQQQTMPDPVANNFFDRAAVAAWQVMEEYVADFFVQQGENIQRLWPEIAAMSAELVEHSILAPQYGTLAIANISELQKLCTYVIYHSTFLHSWFNYKQYEDGGDVEYATIGLWDSDHPGFDPAEITQKHIKQVLLAWTLSQIRHNPILENGHPVLKDLLWQRRHDINPGFPVQGIMSSIHV